MLSCLLSFAASPRPTYFAPGCDSEPSYLSMFSACTSMFSFIVYCDLLVMVRWQFVAEENALEPLLCRLIFVEAITARCTVPFKIFWYRSIAVFIIIRDVHCCFLHFVLIIINSVAEEFVACPSLTVIDTVKPEIFACPLFHKFRDLGKFASKMGRKYSVCNK